ncbi:MAG: hypothetical protein Q6356_000165 [Candidatus Wukongarchaeota archaeon]|nr:hypothetical protein [Candidatus Wukongarchaeota archaeon]
MNEFELKIEARTVFGFIFILMWVVVVFIALFQAFLGVGHITDVIGSEILEYEAMVEVFGWFFMLLIEVLAGYFLASIGVKVYKK